jgi:hypothetical protein
LVRTQTAVSWKLLHKVQQHKGGSCRHRARGNPVGGKAFIDALFRFQTLEIFKSPSLLTYSQPSESERDFRVRLEQAAREERDRRLDRLRAKYTPKLAALEDKIRRAEQAVERESAQARNSSLSSRVRVGTTILGAVLGRKTFSASTINKAGTAVRNVGRSIKESGDVSRAEETVAALRQQYTDLDAEFRAESEDVKRAIDPLTESLETVKLKPKKTNINAQVVALAWTPYWAQADGTTASAWE